jgi:TetR/AcrR family transcriptional regulator, cholesterol catabolism regulator
VSDPSRRDRRKQEMRERILDAAIACFVERGFEQTTMQMIATRADVARATVFNHFADKEALLTGYLDRRRSRLVAILRAQEDAAGDAAQTIYDAFDVLAAENERERRETRELAQAWLRTGRNANGRPTEEILTGIVAAGQQRGELRAEIDAELAGRLLFDAYIGVLIRWAAPRRPPFPLKQTLREVAGTIIAGLRG